MVSGSGTSVDPYVLFSLNDLEQIAVLGLDKYYKLGSDIDVSLTSDPGYGDGNGWLPVGNFTGSFNGNNKKITNLYINRPATDNVGFFSIADTSRITDITFEDVDITGRNYVGGCIGYQRSQQDYSRIHVTGFIHGVGNVGGVIGYLWRSNIYDCTFIGTIIATGNLVGGINGFSDTYTATVKKVSGCSVEGEITGINQVGGIIGAGVAKEVCDCYANAIINGNDYVGGLIGDNSRVLIYDNHFTGEVNGSGNGVGGMMGNISHSGSVYENIVENVMINGSGTSLGVGGMIGNAINYTSYSFMLYSNNVVDCVISGKDRVGGLIGEAGRCNCHYCYSIADVTGNDYVGGLIGLYSQGTNVSSVYECFAEGVVIGHDYVGGLFGNADIRNGTIIDCYANAIINGNRYVGGLIGYIRIITLTNCYSNGLVVGSTDVGGLCGYRYAGTGVSCYWDVETSKQGSSVLGISKTTSQMKLIDTYVDWDFDSVWIINSGINNGYPILRKLYDYDLILDVGNIESTEMFGCDKV